MKEHNEALTKKLAAVQTVGEAYSMAFLAIRAANVVQESLAKYSDFASANAAKMLADAVLNVTLQLKPLQGVQPAGLTEPIPAATWKPLKASIAGLYNAWWAIEEVLPESERQTGWEVLGSILYESAKAVPQLIKDTADLVTDIPTDALSKLLKAAWPLLLAATVILIGGVYLAVSTGAAVTPKVRVST